MRGHRSAVVSTRVVGAGAVALAAVLLMTSSPVAAAGDGQTGRSRSSAAVVPAEADTVLAYWTEQRMERARPLPAPEPRRDRARLDISSQGGRHPTLISPAGRLRQAELVSAETQPAAYSYPFPYTRRSLEAPLYTLASYRAIGKVYFTQNGEDYYCSGASIVSAPRQVVFTAGHCMHGGDASAVSWSGSVVFVPATRNGSVPYGRFAAKQLWVPTAWYTDGDPSFDLGAFSVGRNRAGQKLQGLVGTLGVATDQSRIQHWDVFGYPGAAGFSERRMTVCEASHATDDTAIAGTGPDPMGIGCDMTYGSSGGPWVIQLGRGSYLNGVVSYGYNQQPGAIYSPYFGSAVLNLLCSASGGTGCS